MEKKNKNGKSNSELNPETGILPRLYPSDLTTRELFGNVKQIKETRFKAIKKHGEFEPGKMVDHYTKKYKSLFILFTIPGLCSLL